MSNSNPVDTIIAFDRPTIDPVHKEVPAEKLIEGNPQHATWNYYTNESGEYLSGVWSSTAGKWHCISQRNEFCYMISGVVRLHDKKGNYVEFKEGDSFVIKPEWDGMWEVVEDAKKFYAIYQPE